jgi:hypothetical protein
MARRGFLDYVLGGAVGGLEGLAQQRAAEDEKKRMADAASRQAMLDALAMEDRAQAKEDRLRSQRERLLGSGYVREGMDMPGATPRKAVNTEMVGGERFSVYETPQQMARRAAIEEATLKAKMKPEDKMTPYQVGQAARDERRVRVLEANSRKGGADGLSAKTKDAMRTAEAWFNAPNSNPAQVQLARDVFVALRESRPDAAPQELMLDAYNAVKEQMKMANTAAQIDQRQRSNQPKAGGRTLSNPPGMKKPDAAEDDAFATEWKKYNTGGK